MNVTGRSLFCALVVAVWSLQYASFSFAFPVAFEGSGDSMESDKNEQSGLLYNTDLFEGDIIITPEEYKFYCGDDKTDEDDPKAEHVS